MVGEIASSPERRLGGGRPAVLAITIPFTV